MDILEVANEHGETVHVVASSIAYFQTEQHGTRIYFRGGESLFVEENAQGISNFLRAIKNT